MSDGKLYVVITDKLDASGGENVLDVESGAKKNERNTLEDFAKHKFFNFIEQQTKQFVMYNLNNIGNFTGDYIAQRRVDEVVQGVNILTNIATGALAGAKFGPWGAAIGAAIVVAGTAINAGYQSYSARVENTRTNYNIEQLRRRSGLNTYIDGSRGTEN